ncbi:superoxide dismutase family protein [Pelagerythrobacter sp.]|uniref:superoxide dismutase family protein n=1 Tax=Pelagerythrobacter sp. TaxID=2800702 RepID=UPI0035B2E383
MTRLTLIAALAASASLAGCTSMSEMPTEPVGSATLSLASGAPAGTVQLMDGGDGLSLAVAVTGIPAGTHGFHLHTTGRCTAPDFTSAGGHLNPASKEHGKENPAGSHFGDLPNLVIGSNGMATTTVELDGTRQQAMAWLFDADGTAIVIHADPDDYRSDPTGNAGSRIACGVFERS